MGVASSARVVLALAAACLAVTASLLAALAPWSPEGFAYKCLEEGGGVKAGYVESPLVYYYYVHSVHKTPEIDVLEVTPAGFKPTLVYLRELGAGTPEYVIGEVTGFLVAKAAVSEARQELVVASRGNLSVAVGAAGAWLSVEHCSFISLVPVAE